MTRVRRWAPGATLRSPRRFARRLAIGVGRLALRLVAPGGSRGGSGGIARIIATTVRFGYPKPCWADSCASARRLGTVLGRSRTAHTAFFFDGALPIRLSSVRRERRGAGTRGNAIPLRIAFVASPLACELALAGRRAESVTTVGVRDTTCGDACTDQGVPRPWRGADRSGGTLRIACASPVLAIARGAEVRGAALDTPAIFAIPAIAVPYARRAGFIRRCLRAHSFGPRYQRRKRHASGTVEPTAGAANEARILSADDHRFRVLTVSICTGATRVEPADCQKNQQVPTGYRDSSLGYPVPYPWTSFWLGLAHASRLTIHPRVG